MRSGTLCLGCILRKENPAPQARIVRGLSLPRLPHPRGARFLWAVGTSYNERRLLWAAVRFVQAVTGVRANQPAFMPRLASTAGAEDSMGCGTLCASGILHEKTPAPRGRELYAGSACRAGQPAH